MKKVLITGIAGQDGSYLAELLLAKGYEVHGIVRRVAIEDSEHKLKNIKNIIDKIHLHTTSLDNVFSVIKIINHIIPDECYHLASSSFVNYDFEDEIFVFNNNVNSTHYLLATIKEFAPKCKFYFAGTSEMFGKVITQPQNENTPFNPRSIYGISKVAGYHLVNNYREKYGVFACTGILYNHESTRRGFEFVTRKITSSVAKIKLGMQDNIQLGNLDALRDWGYSSDYVKAMWLMLQQKDPDDFVIATGVNRTVRDFVDCAFNCVGLDYRDYVTFDQRFYREAEKIPLRGNATKAREKLGWESSKNFEEMIFEMVENDLNLHR